MSEQHYENVAEAVEGAKAQLTPQFQPFGLEPNVYQVEVCGLNVVCIPWPHSKRGLAYKGLTKEMSDIQAGIRIMEARFVDTLFWIEGQQQPGRIGALKHARALADLGGKFGNLIMGIATACGDQDDKESAAGK